MPEEPPRVSKARLVIMSSPSSWRSGISESSTELKLPPPGDQIGVARSVPSRTPSGSGSSRIAPSMSSSARRISAIGGSVRMSWGTCSHSGGKRGPAASVTWHLRQTPCCNHSAHNIVELWHTAITVLGPAFLLSGPKHKPRFSKPAWQ